MKYLENLEQNVWRFGETFCDGLERTYSTNGRKRVRRIGEYMFGELEITCSVNWRIRSVNWRLRVRRIGEYVR